MENLLIAIGEKITRIRQAAGLSRAGLGDMLGVKEGAIGKYERGESDPGAAALAKIAKIAGRSIDWLITGTEGPVVDRPLSNDDLLFMALASKPEVLSKVRERVKEEVREEQALYTLERRYCPLAEDERQLVANYRAAGEKIKNAAYRMLEDDAQAAHGKADGGGGGGSS
jgi:transcriptional regulator with XRE-family HTH domain